MCFTAQERKQKLKYYLEIEENTVVEKSLPVVVLRNDLFLEELNSKKSLMFFNVLEPSSHCLI